MIPHLRLTDPKWREKEWFIFIEGEQRGPYSLKELRIYPGFNPDTLVWKKGFLEWKKARLVLELKKIFEEEEDESSKEEDKQLYKESKYSQEQMTLAMQQDPYQFILWILIFLIIVFYTLYQLDGF